MPVFETSVGTRLEIVLPDTEWPELQEAVDEYRKLQAARKAAAGELDKLTNDLGRAVQQDRAAHAAAIREGKPDPGGKAVEKIEKDIIACKRRYEALDVALEDAEIELLDVRDKNNERWLEEIDGSLGQVREEYEGAIDALVEKRLALARSQSLRRWVVNFPAQASYRFVVPGVRKIVSPNGEPYFFNEIESALRADANPPQPVEIPWGMAATKSLRQAT